MKTDRTAAGTGIQRKKEVLQRRIRRGSVTLEAVFLVPLAVFISVLLILLCFYEHNKSWYTSAALEVALVGTAREEPGTDREGQAAFRAQDRIREQPFPGGDPSCQVQMEKNSCRVSYVSAGETFFHWSLPYRAEGKIRQTDPVGQVRAVWLKEKIWDSVR
ncbi:MAG: hypothetical protein Q4B85_06210 [Lachnospiraceae bacterium]|nr:hypothetical protein [Lachnospiraceae bacterium]